MVEASVERAHERDRHDLAEGGRHALALGLEGGGVGGVEVRVQTRREPDPVDRLGVRGRDRLVVVRADEVPDRIPRPR